MEDLIYFLDNDLLNGLNKKLGKLMRGRSVISLKLTPYVYIVKL